MKFFTRKKQILFILLFFFESFIEGIPESTHGENAKNILISEIRISGENASDEFIELYNPTGTGIDLKGWDLKKTTKTGSVENIVTNMEGIIPASGYFLIVPRANCGETKTEACYKGTVEKDAEYTTNNYLAKDNALSLYDQSGSLADKAGWGASVEFEERFFRTIRKTDRVWKEGSREALCRILTITRMIYHKGRSDSEEHKVAAARPC